jgi:cation transport ATPase
VRGAGEDRPLGGLVERLNTLFAPAVALLALLCALLWWWLDPSRVWDQVIALILAACPCAIGLAAPLTYALATGRALRLGLLLRDAGVIERLARLRHAVFDKTGTLTEGRMRVVEWRWAAAALESQRPLIEAAVAAVEARSPHPIALALCEHLRGRELPACPLEGFAVVAGAGVSADCPLGSLRIGSAAFCGLPPGGGDLSEVLVESEGRELARILLDDPPRPGIAAVLERLRARGVALAVCSGDAAGVTIRVARGFGIADARGEMSPEAKAARVAELQQTGLVLMVGDGLNDAPALSRADVAVGMRGGLQAAMDCSHVFLEHDDTALVGTLLDGASRARRCIHACLWVSLAYNLLAIACVMAGWWGPLVCAVAMPVSSLTVVVMVVAGGYFQLPRPTDPPTH